MADSFANKQIAGHRLLSRIAAGGAGTIWKAVGRDKSTFRAVKILNPNLVESPDAVADFEKEYELGQNLTHKGLLKYYDKGEMVDGAPYILMEYFPGLTFKSYAAQNNGEDLRENIETIIENIARALIYIHKQGIIHRDIKPDNILVSETGEIRLIDFSIAVKQKPSLWTRLTTSKKKKAAGTPSYMAPEQIRNESVLPATDLYSFGVTIFEILTGELPFVGNDQNETLNLHLQKTPALVSHKNPAVSMGLDKLVDSMLAKSPQARPNDAAIFLSRFRTEGVYARTISDRVDKMLE